jgi:hypothetical protein
MPRGPSVPKSRAAGPACSPLIFSAHASRHEATNRSSERAPGGPHHGSAGAIGFGDDGIVGNRDPVSIETNAIMSVLRFPVRIGDHHPVGTRAAQPSAASQAFEPRFQGRVGVAAVVACHHHSNREHGKGEQDRQGRRFDVALDVPRAPRAGQTVIRRDNFQLLYIPYVSHASRYGEAQACR